MTEAKGLNITYSIYSKANIQNGRLVFPNSQARENRKAKQAWK